MVNSSTRHLKRLKETKFSLSLLHPPPPPTSHYYWEISLFSSFTSVFFGLFLIFQWWNGAWVAVSFHKTTIKWFNNNTLNEWWKEKRNAKTRPLQRWAYPDLLLVCRTPSCTVVTGTEREVDGCCSVSAIACSGYALWTAISDQYK